MQLQSIGFNPYSSNKPQAVRAAKPSFGWIEVSCTEQARRFLGENTAGAVDDYAKAWLRHFPPEYSAVLNRLVDVVKQLGVDVYRKGKSTVISIADSEISSGHVLGQSD